MRPALKLAIGSLLVGIVVLALKLLAWQVTGSVALLSDALESTVNLVTAFAALIAIQIAAMPADANHPFGHQKAEFFSAVLEGVMIIIAAILILREAYAGFFRPHAIDAPIPGLLINAAATALNAFWAWILVRHGDRLQSPALSADGWHLWADVVTSTGVVLGILLALMTGWWILDPLMAAMVAVSILWSGSRIVKESLGGLMDEAASAETVARIRQIIATEGAGALEAHDLRTRYAGSATFMQFHLVVPGNMTVFDAHEICDRLETAIRQAVPGARITIHVEPEQRSEHGGILISGRQAGRG